MKKGPTRIASLSSQHDGPQQDQALYRFLVHSLIEYAVFAVSPMGIIVSWNTGAQKSFGYTEADMLGSSFERIFTADDIASGAPANELAMALSGERTQHDRWHVRKDKTRFWGTNTVEPLYDGAGALLGFTKLVRDATASYVAFEALSDSEQRLRLLVESVEDYAIFSLDLSGSITSWNAAANKVFGYAPTEIVGRNYCVLFGSDDRAAGLPAAELSAATEHGFANAERWLVRKDGSTFPASGKLSRLKRDAAGDLRGFVRIAHDNSEDHAAAQDLHRRAHYDELTDLPNRRAFYEHVQRALALMKRRSANSCAVLFIDLDRFKAVNDRFGHIVADQLLAVTARRLESCVRSEDVVARIGGDEFAILLNGITDAGDAQDAADRIGVEMRQPVSIDGRDICATVSVGIAIGNELYNRPEEILRDADTAMYAAKIEGRARAVTFDSLATRGTQISVDLIADLRHAVERNELRIAFQPIVQLSDARAVGFEALVRWQHPRRGLLFPSDFIPQAEETDLIVSIDRWMLERACAELARWQTLGVAGAQPQISVNVSSRDFSHVDFVDRLHDVLASTGLDPTCLRLEITEGLAIERSARVHEMFTAIRKLGVKIDIDDFGTGFASLSALQRISVDALKIDSSFVAGLDSPSGEHLVESVISLAHNLGSIAIAEGIETAEQLGRLVALGCDLGQGFLFAPPLDSDGAGRFCAGDRSPSLTA